VRRFPTPSLDNAGSFRPADAWIGARMQEETSLSKRPFLSLLNTWILCAILLVLASTYGFSFERGSKNSTAGGAEQGVAAADSGNSAIVKVQNYAIYLLALWVMLPLVKPVAAEFRRNLLISGLLLWILMSCAWSNDAKASLISGLRMSLDVALAFFLFKRYAINDLLKLLLLVGSVAAVGSIILILVLPQYGLQGRDVIYALGAWQGIFGHKNICGRMMTLLLLPAFFVQLDGRWAKIFRFSYVMVLLVIIGMTHSVGSLLLCGACLSFIAIVHSLVKLKRIDALSLGTVVFGVMAAVTVAVVSNATALLNLFGKDPTMSGRTTLWASVMMSILKHPLAGYGYFAFWQGLTGESVNPILQSHWPGLSYAENGILELWLELGAVAVFLYALIYCGAVKNAIYCFRRYPSKRTMWYISVLFYVAFTNLWAGNLLTPSSLECVVPFIAYVGLRTEARRIRGLQVV
jgi:exopolysaccharide production protein ExoQ